MFTTKALTTVAAERRVLATPKNIATPIPAEGDDLTQEVQLIKARRDALMLAQEAVRFLVPPGEAAQGASPWRDLHQAIDQLQRAVKKLSSPSMFDAGNPLGLPKNVFDSLRDVTPGQLTSTVSARYGALVPAIVAAAQSGHGAEFRRSTQELMFLHARIQAIAKLVARLEAFAGKPENFVKPKWFARQPPGTYPPKTRDDIHQLLEHLAPVQAAMTHPRGPIQQLIAFAKAAQAHPEEVAAIMRQHLASRRSPQSSPR